MIRGLRLFAMCWIAVAAFLFAGWGMAHGMIWLSDHVSHAARDWIIMGLLTTAGAAGFFPLAMLSHNPGRSPGRKRK